MSNISRERIIETAANLSNKAGLENLSLKMIAEELKIEVIKISPLASEWDANLITLAKAIAKQH